MNAILRYIKRFATSTYYGIRQSCLQYILLSLIIQIGFSGVDRRFSWALGGEIACLSISFYTILYIWLNDFIPRLHTLLKFIVPYIFCALIVYLRIESERNGGWHVQRTTLYDFTHLDDFLLIGLFLPLYSLLIIGSEYGLKALLPAEAKRIVKIFWNTLTILLIAFFAVLIILKMC